MMILEIKQDNEGMCSNDCPFLDYWMADFPSCYLFRETLIENKPYGAREGCWPCVQCRHVYSRGMAEGEIV